MARKSSRRQFLRGISAADAMGDAAQAALAQSATPQPSPGVPADSYLLQVSRQAMACQFQVCLNVGQYANDMEAALEAMDLVESLEEQISYFRPGSEISRINRIAAEEPVEVEPRLFQLLELAIQISRQTSGAFDITATPLWNTWGFCRRAGRIPADDELAVARDCVGSRWLELDPDRHSVRFRKPGVEISLGSIGKGYTLDRCGEKLMAAGITDFLIHGGQSSVLAHGCRADKSQTTASMPSWGVGVAHPVRSRGRLAEIRLAGRALATSSSQFQSFRHGGKRYGHILDPRTGRPADKVLAVTVVAPTAALADALSTAFYVLGLEPAVEFCRQRPEIGAVFVLPSNGGVSAQVQAIGLTEAELSLYASQKEQKS